MKNLKKIKPALFLGVLMALGLPDAMGSSLQSTLRLARAEKIFSPTITALTTYPFFSYLSEILPGQGIEHLYIPCTAASLACSVPLITKIVKNMYEHEKEYTTLFNLTRQQKKLIEDRFNKYRPCKELTILKMNPKQPAQASVAALQSKCTLYLPQDFFTKNSPAAQKGLIAHEATHFSKNHLFKRFQLEHAVNVASIVPLVSPLVELETSYLPSASLPCLAAALLASKIKTPVRLLAKKRNEKEADLVQKTPEELFGLMHQALSMYSPDKEETPDLYITIPCSYLLSIDKTDRGVFCRAYLKEKRSLYQKITREHAPNHERLEYLANQFEEQVVNPKTDDIPTSIEECTEALSTYFEKEGDHLTGTPTINAPLIQKRVDFLREKLTEFENKKA